MRRVAIKAATKEKLRITQDWEKSRILTLLNEHKGQTFSEDEIVFALARFAAEESGRSPNGAIGYRYPTKSLQDLESLGSIRKIVKQNSGKERSYYFLP